MLIRARPNYRMQEQTFSLSLPQSINSGIIGFQAVSCRDKSIPYRFSIDVKPINVDQLQINSMACAKS